MKLILFSPVPIINLIYDPEFRDIILGQQIFCIQVVVKGKDIIFHGDITGLQELTVRGDQCICISDLLVDLMCQ
jgi:hypothetical protein